MAWCKDRHHNTLHEDNDLEAVRQAVLNRQRALGRLDAAVRHAHDKGVSWASIGRYLGISRQAARQRFGKPPIPTVHREA